MENEQDTETLRKVVRENAEALQRMRDEVERLKDRLKAVEEKKPKPE